MKLEPGSSAIERLQGELNTSRPELTWRSFVQRGPRKKKNGLILKNKDGLILKEKARPDQTQLDMTFCFNQNKSRTMTPL